MTIPNLGCGGGRRVGQPFLHRLVHLVNEAVIKSMGALFGLLQAGVIVCILAWLLRFGNLVDQETVQKTVLLRFFMEFGYQIQHTADHLPEGHQQDEAHGEQNLIGCGLGPNQRKSGEIL